MQVLGRRREPAPHPPDRVFVPEPTGRKQAERREATGTRPAYRHFPTTYHLVAAVLEALLEPPATALATKGAGDALATFGNEAVRLQAEHGGSSTLASITRPVEVVLRGLRPD